MSAKVLEFRPLAINRLRERKWVICAWIPGQQEAHIIKRVSLDGDVLVALAQMMSDTTVDFLHITISKDVD